jgi:hypothetical protein
MLYSVFSVQQFSFKQVKGGVIRRIGNGRRSGGRPNLTWEESVKRDLKDWSITRDVALDRREWKLAIHVPQSWSSVLSLLLSFYQFFLFIHPFLLSVLLPSSLFLFGFFITLRSLPCFVSVFRLMWVPSLAYPNLIGTKRVGCCCWSKR